MALSTTRTCRPRASTERGVMIWIIAIVVVALLIVAIPAAILHSDCIQGIRREVRQAGGPLGWLNKEWK